MLGACNRDNVSNQKERLDPDDSHGIPIRLEQQRSHETQCVWLVAYICVHIQYPEDAKMMTIKFSSAKDKEKYIILVLVPKIVPKKDIVDGGSMSVLKQNSTDYNVQI